MRIFFDQDAVVEGAWFALVAIDAEVDGPRMIFGQERPLHAARKAGAAATAQTGGLDGIDNLSRRHLVDGLGHTAPGPPPTSTLDSAVPIEVAPGELKMNGITNGVSSGSHDRSLQDEVAGGGEAEPELTGYALAFRTFEIPPARFQIDPAIPPSMLRSRSTKKRTYGGAFGRRPPGVNESTTSLAAAALPVRSSPRNASTANGSEANGSEKAGTPVRRSARGSKLAMELMSLDGPADEEDGSDDQDEEAEYGEKKEETSSSASEVEELEGEDEDSEDDDGDEEADVPEDDENEEDDDEEEEDE